MPAKSKKQAAFLGLVAAGKIRRKNAPSPAQAREMLRGTKVKRLPHRKTRKKGRRK